ICRARAFSSEVGTGSREENASKQKARARSVPIQSERNRLLAGGLRRRSSSMDDLKYGARNKRGDWSPGEAAATAPLFVLPPQPLKLLKWLPSYFLPYNLLFAISAVAWWHWVLPEVETMK